MEQFLSQGVILKNNTYLIIEKIQQGGFGIVYKAEQQNNLCSTVAIKEFYMSDFCERKDTSIIHVTSSNKDKYEDLKTRFKSEAEKIYKLSNPNIVRVFDFFEENNTVYIVMEYLEGGSLDEKIQQNGILPINIALECIKKIGNALAYMHKHNIVHLDIKPSNIMFGKDDETKLIDFGITKQYSHFNSDTQLKSTLIGYTNGFAPIEQYDNSKKKFLPCSDVYALAATFYYCVTGVVPPKSISRSLDDKILEKPSNYNSQINKKTDAVIKRAMELRPADRYQTIDEFLYELSKAIGIKQNEKRYKLTTKEQPIQGNAEKQTLVVDEFPNTNRSDNFTKEKRRSFPQKNTIVILASILLLAMFVLVALTSPVIPYYYYKQGEKHLRNEQYDKATDYFQKAIDKNYPKAMVALGDMYRDGWGVEQDYKQAKKLYVNATDKDYAKAMVRLGNMYRDSLGVEGNYKIAAEWYTKATAKNDPDAMINMGSMYLDSLRWTYNEKLALEWLQKATNLGYVRGYVCMGEFFQKKNEYLKALEWYSKADSLDYPQATYLIGTLYLDDSTGIKKDYHETIEWYTKAANNHFIPAEFGIAQLYLDSAALGKDYEKAKPLLLKMAEQTLSSTRLWTVREAKAFKFGEQSDIVNKLSEHAINAILDARYEMGKLYYKGLGIEKDTLQAEKWFANAMEADIQGKQSGRLGTFYYQEKNYSKAMEYYQKALTLKNGKAAVGIGNMYKSGNGVKKDYKIAVQYYNKGVEFNVPNAYHNMGIMYYYGNGVQQDYRKAMEYCLKASQIGCCGGENNLIGIMYRNGYGVRKSNEEAAKWYMKASKKGDYSGMNNLALLYQHGEGINKNTKEAVRLYKKVISESKDEYLAGWAKMRLSDMGYNERMK